MSTTTTIELVSHNSPTFSLIAPEPLTRSPHYLIAESDESTENNNTALSTRRAVLIVVTTAGVNFLNTLSSGILTVALPTIAKDLNLSIELLLWPASIYALTCGCTLLLAGSIADILGRRLTFLTGSIITTVFTLAVALSPSATALIIFRALQGISISLCLTTAVGIISTSFPSTPLQDQNQSNRRNYAFASTGAASPIGYTAGLVLGGVFVQSVGWRWAFGFAAASNAGVVVAAVWGLPEDFGGSIAEGGVLKRLKREIDWVGASIATLSISLLSYVMAVITGSSSNIHEPQNIIMLSIAITLIPIFVFWMNRQEKLGKPAMIPNSIWKNSPFTTTCLVVFLTWGAFNPFGYYTTLFFQEIQNQSPLQTSLRLLPTVVCGVLTNVVTGLLVRRTSAKYLVAVSSIFSSVSCILMALLNPSWSFWAAAFPAVFLSPMSSDVLYTISNLIIADAFPSSKQSLAGGVFNTVSQIGNSVGLTVGAVIAASVSSSTSNPDSIYSKEQGFKATFWACFASMVLVALIAMVGLRKAGKVGLKNE